jgi:hypothetical protein
MLLSPLLAFVYSASKKSETVWCGNGPMRSILVFWRFFPMGDGLFKCGVSSAECGIGRQMKNEE